MSYKQVGIVNLALYRIGVKKITTMADDTPAAIKATDVWEYIRDEALEAREWKFARVRANLRMLEETPPSGWDYAYLLPTDFLRMALNLDESNDPAVYPSGYSFSIESVYALSLLGSMSDFDPTVTYAVGDEVKVGPYCSIPCDTAGTKILYISAPYGDADAYKIGIVVESNSSDVLSVTEASGIITIKLANATTTKNAANLIQVALRAIGETSDEVDVSGWYVTENAAYTAARPTTGVETGTVYMGSKGTYGDRAWTCATIVSGAASNSSRFPPDNSTYWTEYDAHKLCFLCDYNGVSSGQGVVIQYIRKATDVTLYSPSFVNALAWRLAADLSIPLTEGGNKFRSCMSLYEHALTQAMAANQANEYYKTPDRWSEARRSA